MHAIHIDRAIDARGLNGEAVLMVAVSALNEVAPGGVIELLVSDPRARDGMPAWMARAGHAMLEAAAEGTHARFVIARAA